MAKMIEAVECALCHMPAERWALRSGDDYIYDCPACKGRYAMGRAAVSRAARGEAPPDLLQRVRQHIADGDIARAEVTAGVWQPLKIVGRQHGGEAENY